MVTERDAFVADQLPNAIPDLGLTSRSISGRVPRRCFCRIGGVFAQARKDTASTPALPVNGSRCHGDSRLPRPNTFIREHDRLAIFYGRHGHRLSLNANVAEDEVFALVSDHGLVAIKGIC